MFMGYEIWTYRGSTSIEEQDTQQNTSKGAPEKHLSNMKLRTGMTRFMFL